MKQVIDFKSLWFNTKRALYGTMVIAVALSIPVLSYVELSHTESEEKKTEIMQQHLVTEQPTIIFFKQS